jgi:hypothetical protein
MITNKRESYMIENLNLVQLTVSGVLFGLILTIQFVHYPAFKFVSEQNFYRFHKSHTANISLIVIPLMLVEIIIVGFIAIYDFSFLGVTNAFIVLLIWMSTFFISVPIHRKLEKERSLELINRLIKSNWIRTLLWGLKLAISFLLI